MKCAAPCRLLWPVWHRNASGVSFGNASRRARASPSRDSYGTLTEAWARSSARRTSTRVRVPARTRASASAADSLGTLGPGLGALGLSMARPLPRMSSTQSMVMPSARRALAGSNWMRRPSLSTAIAFALALAIWKLGRKLPSIDSASALPSPESASALRSISAAAGVTVTLEGGVRSIGGRPSASFSSPLLAISSMMSLPPTSSPPMYSCGIVGQSP